MSYAFVLKVKQASEDLVSENLKHQSWHLLLSFLKLHNVLVKVHAIVIHYYVQVLLFPLVSEEVVLHFQNIGVRNRLQDFKLSVFVFPILKDSFYRNILQGFLITSFENSSESPRS